jgi:hypothetical protein
MGKDLKLTITRQLKELVYVKNEVSTYLDVHYVSPAVAYKVNMVLEQVISGIISYTEKDDERFPIRIYLGIRGRELVMELVWQGHAYNPVVGFMSAEKELEELSDFELGAHVVRKLSKSARYSRAREKNENHLEIIMRSGLH